MSEHLLDSHRHSLAHLLAMVVLARFPEAKLGIGPVIEDGFYYDFDLGQAKIGENELASLTRELRELASQKLEFVRLPVNAAAAREQFAHQPFKLELIDELVESKAELTLYQSGDFIDLCKGGHVDSTDAINPQGIDLTRVAGAYWRGDAKRPMLTRIYGVYFAEATELAAYHERRRLAEEYDHRKLGRELDLFTFSDLVGAGLPLFTPKGTFIRDRLASYIQSLQQPLGYQKVNIPHIAKSALYQTSGHYEKFKDDLFYVKSQSDEFVMKPMNCPHHSQIYASKLRSYRDLPIRYAEITTCYRDEQPGELSGLTRVRALTQDDGHAFVRSDQIHAEVMAIYRIIQTVYKTFQLPLTVRLSLRDPANPGAYLGDDAIWEEAESSLKLALAEFIEPQTVATGEAAFYGPKLDFLATDALGRQWQVATIQLDFNLAERFDLHYTDQTGQAVRPIVVHRAIYGSIERFMAIILEHLAGNLPTWLSPVQIKLLPVSDKFIEYIESTLVPSLSQAGIRFEIDYSNESVGKKIRLGITEKIPYLAVIGEQEITNQTISIRDRASGQNQPYTLAALIALIQSQEPVN
ncbi:MAG: threonyl-tRNA synthetase [Candidatus Berkelbacteria bacterium Gr01-1014_85]|uniref:Threonine--tRNA ligase n=1 Tax=Candidatus Berkelbacteria bacterium Gr01-1014_85 TaxID=2017150 RepID=A0A554JBA2_9BACT|nr:MAG: threonyl-tRNA synthetase [Candidatus Berkelbacteria bacterium Gr01-1014_85]